MVEYKVIFAYFRELQGRFAFKESIVTEIKFYARHNWIIRFGNGQYMHVLNTFFDLISSLEKLLKLTSSLELTLCYINIYLA